jgi:hypothetical protein
LTLQKILKDLNVERKFFKGIRLSISQRTIIHLIHTSIKDLNYGESNVWALIVDNFKDHSWVIFLSKKSDLNNNMFTIFTDLKISGIGMKIIRCDVSGENEPSYDSC